MERGAGRALALAWVTALASVACGPGEVDTGSADESAPSAPRVTSGDSAPAPATAATVDSTDWTVGLLQGPSVVTGRQPLPVLTALRAGAHPEYERVTVEMDVSPGELPGYRLEYVDRPLRDCGSGFEIHPVGDAWLELRLEPAAAHTEAGAPTLGDRQIAVNAPLLQRIYRTCDFEGVVVLVLALSSPNPFRVLTLSDPPRLAVDIRR